MFPCCLRGILRISHDRLISAARFRRSGTVTRVLAMSQRFACPRCGRVYSVIESNAGKRARCPGCHEVFTFPVLQSVPGLSAPADDHLSDWLQDVGTEKTAQETTARNPRLMNCPDCGREVSIRAASCPHCGCPIAPAAAPAQASPPEYGDPGWERRPPAEPQPGQNDMELALLATQDFTGRAVLTLVLYFVFYIPGLIANFVFLGEANRIQRRLQREPDGKGCLTALAALFFWLPLGLLLFGIINQDRKTKGRPLL